MCSTPLRLPSLTNVYDGWAYEGYTGSEDWDILFASENF